jgi:hypothetical protein
MRLRLPFVCPLDHIFEPFHFDDDEHKFGPAIRYREHSFLENERILPQIRSGMLSLCVVLGHNINLVLGAWVSNVLNASTVCVKFR